MIETKLNGTTPDIAEENIAKLKEIFPDVFCEGKVDFEKLQQVLGNYVEDAKERYNFSWNGKGKTLKLAQSPSTGTLLPCKEESKDWDTTENLYIEGDNLEVLKLLQKSYHNKIKMIYIDPPYNTGHDFVYKDNFKDNLQNYLEITGQTDEDGNKMTTNSESNGRYHTDWLNMMYPRLRLARNLLTDDGIILTNIDEHELINLQKLCNEIFGEDNDLGTIIWDKRNPKGDARGVSYQHEYILLYAKNKDKFLETCKIQRPKKNANAILKKAEQFFAKINDTYSLENANEDFAEWIKNQQDLSGGERAYCKIDDKGNVYQAVSMSWPNKKKAPDEYFIPLIHPITKKECPVPERGWRNPPETMRELLNKNQIIFGKDETTQPRRKYLLKENMFENIPSLLYYGGSDTDLLSELEIPFDTPKSVDVVMEHIRALTKSKEIILDFFSGSATTAHAVMQLNAEDGGNRKFICVQLPEPCDESSEAFKAGYENICEIGKERIRRAGEKIKSEIESANIQITLDENEKKVPDIGFKVFKLNSSNIKKWQPDFDEIEDYISNMENNFVDDRTELDVVYEIMIKYGLDLTYPVEELSCGDTTLYSIGMGMLIICLANNIGADVAKFISDYKQENEIDGMRVVFRDGCFGGNDSLKTNIKEILKVAGVEEFITI